MISSTSVKSISFYIMGSGRSLPGRATLPVTNPATGEVLAEVPLDIGGRHRITRWSAHQGT